MQPMFINGQWVSRSSDGEVIDVVNPATEEIIDSVPNGSAADADKAVQAAKSAFKEWRWTSAYERAELMQTAANKLRHHFDAIAELLTLEEGKAISENEEEVEWVIGSLEYYAGLIRNSRGRVLQPAVRSQFNFTLKEPYGVVAAIVPFNFPLLLMIWKVAPALAAGNTVVIKPSDHTPLSTLKLMDCVFDDFPPGVINVLTGRGERAGEALVAHPDVPVVAFTGSTAIGRRISEIGSRRIKRLHLELGGKDPFVIAPDADVETAAEAVAYAALINAGQVCTSTERVYVPEQLAGAFTGALVDFVQSLKLGPGLERTTDMGPLAAPHYRQKVLSHIEDAKARGAKILTGGKAPAGLERGWYLEPTVLTNVNHSMVCMREETFGPTIPVMTYRTFDEAIELCNDSDYGLGACLRSNDPRLIKRFFDEVQGGTIWINDPLTDNYGGPFGGFKMSGNARELGEEGLESFLETKHVHWDFSDEVKDYWYPYS
ncbi:MAG: Betaine aldehyde dehydrogenase [Anaerolineae bacterium]|nr:Betaine aldehyde dehydrogenase [Anaerolineae bacterium]